MDLDGNILIHLARSIYLCPCPSTRVARKRSESFSVSFVGRERWKATQINRSRHRWMFRHGGVRREGAENLIPRCRRKLNAFRMDLDQKKLCCACSRPRFGGQCGTALCMYIHTWTTYRVQRLRTLTYAYVRSVALRERTWCLWVAPG